ncbi:MAG: type II toxin-antitoxin system VapC family toxin [Tsuneonella sp.]
MTRLLIDTHILIWIVLDDRRLSAAQRVALGDSGNAIVVSPVVAYELTHLQRTGRIPLSESIDRLQGLVGFETAELPFECWRIISSLPVIHRDPIDRLLIAHALTAELTLVTADSAIRRYPIKTL